MPVTTTTSPVWSGFSVCSDIILPLRDLAGGRVHGLTLSLAGRPRHCLLDGHSGARADAGHLRDLVDLGRPQLLQRAEVLDQGAATHLAEAGYVVEQALDHRLGVTRPVVGDGEPVRLVADPLQEGE